MTSLVFRVAAGVVNTAACAVNHLLEVMYPAEPQRNTCCACGCTYTGPAGRHNCIYSPAAGGSCGPAPTDPPSGGVADPAGDAAPPLASPAGSLSWFGWSYPCGVEVLAEHGWRPTGNGTGGQCRCRTIAVEDEFEWRDHVSALISERIACDPSRALAALQNLQTQE